MVCCVECTLVEKGKIQDWYQYLGKLACIYI